MTEKFVAEKEIFKTLDKILQEHGLVLDLIMSTSGTNHVVQCHDENNKNFIIKILRKTSAEAKEAFLSEAKMNKFFSEQTTLPFTAPEQVFLYDQIDPIGLAYSLVEGEPAGWYYFYTGTKQVRTIGAETIITALNYLQNNSQSLNDSIGFSVINQEQLSNKMKSYHTGALAGGLSEEQYSECHSITQDHVLDWLKNPVLVHGDFNPKNILVTPEDGFGIIDWSDAHLNCRYYDLAFMWLCFWRTPDVQDDIIKQIENSTDFFQLVCYWLPKFYSILHDVKTALIKEFDEGSIPLEAKVDNLEYIKQAQAFYVDKIDTFIAQAKK
ncbi:MAG: aminoglycoside phosphotransferase family protein [bacterium]|nr:aminoglycoside phosphotransferase family protein [bacterium]